MTLAEKSHTLRKMVAVSEEVPRALLQNPYPIGHGCCDKLTQYNCQPQTLVMAAGVREASKS